ncbi:MAG: ribonuclease HII [Eubacteriales bacterium]|nr:ribonuclease HII [Eubacteriales bacterium]
MNDLWTLENEIYDSGVNILCGVDEAGRGPLAGPVCAAAVILPRNCVIEGLNDSKKLTEKKREELFDVIRENAVSYGIAFASVEEIEEYNILQATFIAMNRAIEKLDVRPELALIDGNRNKGIIINSRCVVKGDACCADIAAASVLAKVTRDRYMYEMEELYPQYGFDKHKGYGTKLHYEALRKYGPSPIHRLSFLRKMH